MIKWMISFRYYLFFIKFASSFVKSVIKAVSTRDFSFYVFYVIVVRLYLAMGVLKVRLCLTCFEKK